MNTMPAEQVHDVQKRLDNADVELWQTLVVHNEFGDLLGVGEVAEEALATLGWK